MVMVVIFVGLLGVTFGLAWGLNRALKRLGITPLAEGLIRVALAVAWASFMFVIMRGLEALSLP